MKIRKNGKVINLTESDLRKITKYFLNEQGVKGYLTPEKVLEKIMNDRQSCTHFQEFLDDKGIRTKVNGRCNRRHTRFFDRFAEEYMDILQSSPIRDIRNKGGEIDNNLTLIKNKGGEIPMNDRECSSLMKSSDLVGGSPSLRIPGRNVTVSHFTDGGPRNEAMMFSIGNNQPFCKVSGRFKTDDCDWEIPPYGEDGSSAYLELSGNVTLEHFIDGGPRYEKWIIKEDGDYVCSFNER